jgi:glycosyltransferase involved in cell wall biosynthesis
MESVTSITSLQIVTPVYNDWASFCMLLRTLDGQARRLGRTISVLAIDDGSTQRPKNLRETVGSLQAIERVEVLHLALNVGHQRAIAIGLCHVAETSEADAIVVMDSDGEDPPACIAQLLQAAEGNAEFCVVAARRKRSEKLAFRTGYVVYKTLFKLVTGTHIDFGNFSFMSPGCVRRLTMLPDLWNNLAAALLRSRMPLRKVFMDRGTRYAGRSKMNFTSLIVHGFSTISVYSDSIFVRLLMTTMAMMGVTALGVGFVVFLRVFHPQHTTPGWATTVSAGLIVILLQVLFATFTSLMMLLNNRTQRLMLPAHDYKPYIRSSEVLRGEMELVRKPVASAQLEHYEGWALA